MHLLRLLVITLPLAACGSPPARVSTVPEPVAAGDDPCPVTIPGTSVTVEDTATGAALVFVTTGDVEVLRARVSAWAEGHTAHHAAMGPLPTGDEPAAGGHDHSGHGGHEGHGGGGAAGGGGPAGGGGGLVKMINVHSQARATSIDGGARLELIAFPSQVGTMQEHLRGHAQHLASGSCAMPAGH